jgi:hypothetical protein
MRTFPAEEALVVAYWRKLASSIQTAHKSPGPRGPGTARCPKSLRESAQRAEPTS